MKTDSICIKTHHFDMLQSWLDWEDEAHAINIDAVGLEKSGKPELAEQFSARAKTLETDRRTALIAALRGEEPESNPEQSELLSELKKDVFYPDTEGKGLFDPFFLGLIRCEILSACGYPIPSDSNAQFSQNFLKETVLTKEIKRTFKWVGADGKKRQLEITGEIDYRTSLKAGDLRLVSETKRYLALESQWNWRIKMWLFGAESYYRHFVHLFPLPEGEALRQGRILPCARFCNARESAESRALMLAQMCDKMLKFINLFLQ